MRQDQLNFLNDSILKQAKNLKYTVKIDAPQNEIELFNSSSLIVWSGSSDNTIYRDKSVNYMFRALHDDLHLKTGLGFSPKHEVELGRIQASKQSSNFLAELIFCEVAMQAIYFEKTGLFVADQVTFNLNYLKQQGVI